MSDALFNEPEEFEQTETADPAVSDGGLTEPESTNAQSMGPRQRLVRLGQELLSDGLVVRTWGNFSLRSEDDHFLVTPSGRRYETMQDADLADVDAAGEWTGPLKPSGETPMHRLIYREFPQAGCVIHTHQPYASALTFEASPIELNPDEAEALGQPVIPVAPYALPTTGWLHKNVEKTYATYPLQVLLLKAHGALIWAADADEARRLANVLEEIAQRRYWHTLSHNEPASRQLVHSERVGQGVRYFGADGEDITPDAEIRDVHEQIYARQPEMRVIINSRDCEVATFYNTSLVPYLDDFAQLVGTSADASGAKAATLTHNNAFCAGRDHDDAHAVRLVLEKNARAARYARLHKGQPINGFEVILMRQLYVRKYAKQAD